MQSFSTRSCIVFIFKFEQALHINLVLLCLTVDKQLPVMLTQLLSEISIRLEVFFKTGAKKTLQNSQE